MISRAAAEGRERQAAADDLAEDRQVGRDAVALLRAAARDAEAGDHLVEDEQRARRRRRARAAPRGSPGAGGTQPMFPATGSTKIAARSSPWRSTAAAASVDVVVGDDDRVGDDRGRDAGRGRDAERREPGAGLGEEGVGVAVVAAGELEHAVAAA